jgi:hypothetical protein
MFENIKAMAKEFGRDTAALRLIARANVELSEVAIDENRGDFAGTLEQIAGDVAATREAGASEIVFDIQFASAINSVDDMVHWMERLRRVATSS